MSRKTIYFISIFFYISLIIGFFFDEDINGGAKADFAFYENIISSFSNNFVESFLNYSKFNERHSPVILIFFSILTKINVDIEYIRILNLHINLLTIYYFYQCLSIKFSEVNKNYLILLSLVMFISPSFRSLSIWPDSRIIGLLFFVISLKFFLEFQVNKDFKLVLKNIFFLSVSSYFSPNFSIFSIYFFFQYLFILRDLKKIVYIIILNILLSIPAFYYLFILNVNFIKLGLTPGSSLDLNINSVEFNLSNKIICIISIIFYYSIPIYLNIKNNFEKSTHNIFLAVIFILIYLYSIFNFNYQLSFTGGGIFLHISNNLLNNNFLLYFVSLIAFYYFFIKEFNFNNFFIIIILILSNPQLTIYHKYYDPLVLILMFTIFDFKLSKNFFSKNNISLIYAVYFFLIISKIGQKYLQIL